MKNALMTTVLASALAAFLQGCERPETETPTNSESPPDAAMKTASDTHVHADGSQHAGHGGANDVEEQDHEHDEVSLGTVSIGNMKVEFTQGHGKVQAGKEGHLVVKLPYNDKGATIVRAWIGTNDRLESVVGKGDYAASPDDYDVHAVAPDPLPKNTMWWVEIQKPDGKKLVGSVKPLLD